MAVRTQAQLLAEVQSLLVDNSQIRASAVRTLENDIIDTMFSPKVYYAVTTQSGINAPVITEIKNTLGGALTPAYVNIGNYSLTCSGLFTANKTICLIGSPNDGDYGSQVYKASIRIQNTNTAIVDTDFVDSGSTTGADGVLLNTSIVIFVFP